MVCKRLVGWEAMRKAVEPGLPKVVFLAKMFRRLLSDIRNDRPVPFDMPAEQMVGLCAEELADEVMRVWERGEFGRVKG